MTWTQCQRPGCGGTYEDMGGGELYCDICGLAPVVPPGGSPSSPPTGATGGGRDGRGSNSSSARGSSRSSSRSARSQSSRRSVSGRLSRALSGPATSRSVSVRSSGAGVASSARGRLGAGLVTVEPIPRPDPHKAVQKNPEVPERKRFCSRGDCGAPVGRSRGDRPGRTEGFCTKCGHPYSFVPKLASGDIVHGQYEVVGCLAYGGLGWVYLAIDRAVSDRWVVLKGLLDTGDQDAMAAAISERRFLAEIEHANIVRIYNFVEHLDQRTGSMDGYIVMEYVGGKSLKEIANERRTAAGKRDPLPVEQACAFALEALEALAHLHSRSLLYCDFKVDNAIQTEDQLKLIDMGAVRRMDDEDSAIYGTVGYQAPEVAETGPSIASDLYTVARTLAVLTFDFQGYTNVFVDSLPDPDNIEVFRTYESFYRLLVRATDPDPARRFASAQEMAEQLTGVLREVVAVQTGRPRPALSTLFGPEVRVTDTELFVTTGTEVSALGARALPLGRRARKALTAHAPEGAPEGGGAGAGTPRGPSSGGTEGLALPAPGTAASGLPVATAGGALGGGPAAVGTPAPAGQGPARAPDGEDPAGALSGSGGQDPAGARSGSGGIWPHGAVPAASTYGGGPGGGRGTGLKPLQAAATAMSLPVPRIDPADPNAGFLAGLMASAPTELISALSAAPADSPELRLRELRARLDMGETASAAHTLAELESRHPDDWRVVWYRGVTSLTTGDREAAALSFDAVYDAFPGEPAPKLALGVCAEELGQLDNAAEYYRLVWTTDPSYVSAAFGLARVQLAAGDRTGAVKTLESVPESSIHFTAARVAAVRARLRRRAAYDPLLDDLTAAAGQVEALDSVGLDAERRELLSTEVLGTALDWVLSGSRGAAPPGASVSGATGAGTGAGGTVLLGSPVDERGLRFGLERSYRTLARLAQRGEERIELVERANRFRPRTWV
ncbi:serine/threonine-protein kinase [Streptomyces tsukubensis]|uniref:Serine/threonine-protein kinase PknG n=1 Tax=Streptomyces tsukubensis TaxID=83656 RepID=A0A1V4ABK1_9ACTN|nr:serine/threonine-protein kinase [Streptomyces tsukubensis]OON80751.1 serine/threonine protein kinase [Streptomyces tsukubensis]QFR93610.1 tetratricopeptide repeat protein [Streptomyces tsukubensis]